MTAQDRDPAAALDRLKWPLRLTRWGMLAERLTQAFWPVPVILFATLAIIFFGALDAVSIEVAWAGAVLIVVALVAALVLGARRFHWPSRAEAAARLDATLPGRPISALATVSPSAKGTRPRSGSGVRIWPAWRSARGAQGRCSLISTFPAAIPMRCAMWRLPHWWWG